MEKSKVKKDQEQLLALQESFNIGINYPELNFAGRLKQLITICNLDKDLILEKGSLRLEGLKLIITLAKRRVKRGDPLIISKDRTEKIICSGFVKELLAFGEMGNRLPIEQKNPTFEEQPEIRWHYRDSGI